MSLLRHQLFPVLIVAISLLNTSAIAQDQIAGQNLCPGTQPSFLSVGMQGRVAFVDGTSTRLRAGAGTNFQILVEMSEGTEFTVIGGHECAVYTWWQIRLEDGTIGWVAEGIDGEYWIEPIPDGSAISTTQNSLAELAEALVGIWMLDVQYGGPPTFYFCPDGSFHMFSVAYGEHGSYTVLDASTILVEAKASGEMVLPQEVEYTLTFRFEGESLILNTDGWSNSAAFRRIEDDDDDLCSIYIFAERECGIAPAPRLIVGEQGRNVYGSGTTRVRAEPRGENILYEMQEGETFDVLEGPVCRESPGYGNLNWWRIRVHSNNIIGWSPEGTQEIYWLEPYQASVPIPTQTIAEEVSTLTPEPSARVFDRAVNIDITDDGSLVYSTDNGCELGTTPPHYLRNPVFSEAYTLQLIQGCDGYRIELVSIPWPSCYLQVTMYGPNFQDHFKLNSQEHHPTCIHFTNDFINAMEYAVSSAPEWYSIYDNVTFIVKMIKGTMKGWVIPVEIGCNAFGNLETLRPGLHPLITRGDFLCVWVGTGIGLAAGTPVGFIPILIEPEKYVDPWLEQVNEFAWSLPITCFFFPDFNLCQQRNR